jgi:hypothetical protein
LGEPFSGCFRSAPPYPHHLQRDHVALAIGDVAEEIGDAETTLLAPREPKAPGFAVASNACRDQLIITTRGGDPFEIERQQPRARPPH